jgi:HEAT repeat protein
MVREEASRDVCGELADILIDVLQSMTQCEAQTSALRVLNEFASMYVRQASFGQAAHILGRLRALAANETVDVDLRAHAAEQLLALGDRSCTEAVAEALKEHENVDKAELARFFTMLPASAAPELCELMQIERYNDTVCSAVRHLVTDNPQLLTAKLAVSNVEVAKKVLGILDGMAVPELGRALVDPLTAAEDAVKMASIRLLSRIGGPAARGILLTYAEGADAALRRSALKALAAFGGPPVPTPVLRRRVLARDFDDRTLEEKKTLLVALAKLESVLAISFLEEVLSRKKWFEKPGHAETRACAAFALGEMGDDGARAILKRFVSDRAEVVRTAAGLALRRGAATTACTGA